MEKEELKTKIDEALGSTQLQLSEQTWDKYLTRTSRKKGRRGSNGGVHKRRGGLAEDAQRTTPRRRSERKQRL